MQSRKTSRSNRQYHGLGGTPTYRSWYSMIERCTNPKNASWVHYGAKGIRVCDRWLSLASFVADMGPRPDGTTLDRVDRTRDYEPANCRWATGLEQQRNRGGVKCSEVIAEHVRTSVRFGATQQEVAASVGLHQSSISRIVGGKTWR